MNRTISREMKLNVLYKSIDISNQLAKNVYAIRKEIPEDKRIDRRCSFYITYYDDKFDEIKRLVINRSKVYLYGESRLYWRSNFELVDDEILVAKFSLIKGKIDGLRSWGASVQKKLDEIEKAQDFNTMEKIYDFVKNI